MTPDAVRDRIAEHLRWTLLPCNLELGIVTFDPVKVADAVAPVVHALLDELRAERNSQ